MQVARSQLKTGQRPTQPNVRSFKENDVLFKEGDRGREMYIIQEGEVRITRGSKEGEIELARIGPGSVLGEMSLLDNMPRSATGKATKTTKAMIINEMVFNAVLQKVPPWLTSIVRIITSRIRDVNKRVGQSILRNREAGVASLLNLLVDAHQKVVHNHIALDLDFVTAECYYVCRLGRAATESTLKDMAAREVLEMGVDTGGKKCILFKDREVLALFVEYYRLKERGREFVEVTIPDNEVDLLNNVVYVAQKSGKETKEGTELPMKAFMEDMAQKNLKGLESMLSNLQRREVISIFPSTDGSDNVILFKKEMLTRIRKIKEWIGRFTMDPKNPSKVEPSKQGAS